MLRPPVFVMLADQFTACNQASSRFPPSLDLPQKATAAAAQDRLNGREFVKKRERGRRRKKKWPSRNVDVMLRSRFFLIWIRNGP